MELMHHNILILAHRLSKVKGIAGNTKKIFTKSGNCDTLILYKLYGGGLTDEEKSDQGDIYTDFQ